MDRVHLATAFVEGRENVAVSCLERGRTVHHHAEYIGEGAFRREPARVPFAVTRIPCGCLGRDHATNLGFALRLSKSVGDCESREQHRDPEHASHSLVPQLVDSYTSRTVSMNTL